MQHVGAMRIDHAFRVAGGAGGVAHAGRGILVERSPGEIVVDLADPFLIGDRVAQRGGRQMRRVGEHHVALDRDQPVGELLQERQEGEIGHQHARLGMVDDPGDLVGEQARIDGVIDGADPQDAVPGFQMPGGIPGERRHPVTEPDAVAVEPLGHPQRPAADRPVGGGHQRAFHRARMDGALAMVQCGMIDDAMAQKRPVLHQSQHGGFPNVVTSGFGRRRCGCHPILASYVTLPSYGCGENRLGGGFWCPEEAGMIGKRPLPRPRTRGVASLQEPPRSTQETGTEAMIDRHLLAACARSPSRPSRCRLWRRTSRRSG